MTPRCRVDGCILPAVVWAHAAYPYDDTPAHPLIARYPMPQFAYCTTHDIRMLADMRMDAGAFGSTRRWVVEVPGP